MEKQMGKQYQMPYISHDKLRRSEFYKKVSAKDRVQDFYIDGIKLKVNNT